MVSSMVSRVSSKVSSRVSRKEKAITDDKGDAINDYSNWTCHGILY